MSSQAPESHHPPDTAASETVSPLERVRRAAREIVAGTMNAIWMLAYMLTLGLIAFGPLGDAAVDSGVRAAFAAAIFGNLTAAILGSALMPNEVPRASTVLVFASFVTRLAADPSLQSLPARGVPEIVFLAAACLLLSGVLQIVFGVLRLGSVVRYVPYPVVAGFMTGLAVSLALYELPELLGLHQGVAGPHMALDQGAHSGLPGWPLVVGAATIVIVLAVSLRWSKAPSRLIGIVGGTAIAMLIVGLVPDARTGPTLPPLSGTLPWPDALLPLLRAGGLELLLQHGYEVAFSAAVLAVVGALDSLLTAVGEEEGPLDAGHQPNRLIVTLGFGNIASALFGGVPVAYSSAQAMASRRRGGRRTITTLTTSAVLLLLLLYGGPLLATIPLAVFAGVNITIAIGLFDRWVRDMLQRALRHLHDRELQRNLLVVAFVAAVTVIFGPVPAVLVGLVLSMGLFIAVMNRSLVRSTTTGVTRASRRVYPPEQSRLLRNHGGRTAILELDGAIFFGTAERLAEEADAVPDGTRFLVLDLHRVTMLDASGALTIERLERRLHERGIGLLLAHINATSRLGAALTGAGLFTERHHTHWFDDVDRALEWAERALLTELLPRDLRAEIPLSDFALARGLPDADLAFIKPYLDRQHYPARAVLFREGDAGDRLYLLARGAISIAVEQMAPGHANTRRIVTLAPGVIFGESAALEGSPRAVTAMVEEEAVVYSLSRKSLEAIRRANLDLYARLLQNLLHHVSAQLRTTVGVVRESGDRLD